MSGTYSLADASQFTVSGHIYATINMNPQRVEVVIPGVNKLGIACEKRAPLLHNPNVFCPYSPYRARVFHQRKHKGSTIWGRFFVGIGTILCNSGARVFRRLFVVARTYFSRRK